MSEALTAKRSPAVTILMLSLASTIGLGIARFGYALVLPDMRDSLGWSYSAAGFMNTINAAGYLAGALGIAALTRRIGLYATVRLGVIACVLSLALCALTSNFVILSIYRLIAGFGAALAFIGGGAIAAHIAQDHPDRSSFLLGLYYGGPGIGIAASGIVAPWIYQALGAGSWQIVWAAFAALSFVSGLLLVLARVDPSASSTGAPAEQISPRKIWIYLVGYFCFGAGYIAYMTFMIAYVRNAGGGPAAQTAFWALIGLGTFVSPWLWPRLLPRGQNGLALSVLMAINAVAAALPLVSQSPLMLALSAFGFGTVMFAIVGATTTFVRFNYPSSAWPKAMAMMTIVFGLGQVVGPIVTGAISDALGSLSSALMISAATLAAGAVAAAFQRQPSG